VLLLIVVIFPPLLRLVSIPLGAMIIAGFGIILLLQRKNTTKENSLERAFKIAHPLKLSTAIKFGLVFAVVLIIIEFAQESFGSIGVYFASAIAGLTDVDAIALSVSRLASNAQLDIQVAGLAVVIAALMNTIAKGAIAYFMGSQDLRRTVMCAFSAIFFVGFF